MKIVSNGTWLSIDVGDMTISVRAGNPRNVMISRRKQRVMKVIDDEKFMHLASAARLLDEFYDQVQETMRLQERCMPRRALLEHELKALQVLEQAAIEAGNQHP